MRTRLVPGTLLALATVGVLAPGCSSGDEPAAKADPSKSAAPATRNDVEEAAGAVDRALLRFVSNQKRYPETVRLDPATRTLRLAVAGGASDKVHDEASFGHGLTLGWYAAFPDPRVGTLETTKGHRAAFSYCLGTGTIHKVTSGNATTTLASVRKGPCPGPPTGP